MRIDAIIQSSSYADMLAITLPLNKAAFDSVIVYTKRGDTATQVVCAANDVRCIETDRFTQNGSRFNRGAVFNEAFRGAIKEYSLGLRIGFGWICMLDSDIVMPAGWRETFEGLPPERECFYGARRYNVETAEQWAAVQADPEYLKQLTLFRGYGYSYVTLHHVGSSTFLRLWETTQGNPYPEWRDGSTADWMFRNQWGDCPWDPPTQPPDHTLDHSVPEPCDAPTGLLRKLPFNVIHLGISGVNATGRHTPLWTAAQPAATLPPS